MFNDEFLSYVYIGVFLLLIFIVLSLLYNSVVIIPTGHKAVLERFGQYNSILDEGIHFLSPVYNIKKHYWSYEVETKDKTSNIKYFTEYYVPIYNQQYDPPSYDTLTTDRINVQINIVLTYRIIDLKIASYRTNDPLLILQNNIQTSLKDAVQGLTLDQVNNNPVSIGVTVTTICTPILQEYGLQIINLKIQNVSVDKSISNAALQALTNQRKLEAEMKLLKLENDKKHLELEMESKLQLAKMNLYKTKADIINSCNGGKDTIEFIQNLMYLEAWEKVVNNNNNNNKTTIIVPSDMKGLLNTMKTKSQ